MLIYHPAFDSYHCLFRLMFIILNLEHRSTEIDKLRIIDFYLIFPKSLAKTRFPIESTPLKQKLQIIEEDYRKPVDPKIVFRNMQEIQISALNLILSIGQIEPNDFKKGLVTKTCKDLPDDFAERIEQFNIYGDSDLPKKIISYFLKQPLNGANGIKHRTEIMDYRYDHA